MRGVLCEEAQCRRADSCGNNVSTREGHERGGLAERTSHASAGCRSTCLTFWSPQRQRLRHVPILRRRTCATLLPL